MKEHLITKEDIQVSRGTVLDVDSSILFPFIDKAHTEDLRSLLGNDVYFKIMSDQDNYSYLIHGCSFECNGIDYIHEGLKEVLCNLSYARFIIHGSFHVTSFGFVEKYNQDSKPVPKERRRDIKTMSLQSANSAFELVKKYMKSQGIISCESVSNKRKRFTAL